MKKYLTVLPVTMILLLGSLPVSAKTYTKLELLTAVLNNVYSGTGRYTEQTCGATDDKPTIEVTFDDIDTAGTVVAASIYDGDLTYASTGTIHKKSGNSFYTLKLDGGYSSDTADYTVTLKGRITKTNPSIVRKVKVGATAELSSDSSVHCEVSMSYKKLHAE